MLIKIALFANRKLDSAKHVKLDSILQKIPRSNVLRVKKLVALSVKDQIIVPHVLMGIH